MQIIAKGIIFMDFPANCQKRECMDIPLET
jgi:hypothetical protein